MICPVCGDSMEQEDFGGVMVDVCKNGCKGIWFDWMELKKLDEESEGCGKALESALKAESNYVRSDQPVNCPKCNIPMHIHKYQFSKEVSVDECYACGGFFLDAGELAAIRETFMSDEDINAFADKLAANVPSYQSALQDHEKEKDRVEAIRNYTRFLRIFTK